MHLMRSGIVWRVPLRFYEEVRQPNYKGEGGEVAMLLDEHCDFPPEIYKVLAVLAVII